MSTDDADQVIALIRPVFDSDPEFFKDVVVTGVEKTVCTPEVCSPGADLQLSVGFVKGGGCIVARLMDLERTRGIWRVVKIHLW